MDNKYWLEKAKKGIEKLDVGVQFALKELYDIEEWGLLSRGEKIMLGKVFANEVREGNFSNIVSKGEKKNGSSQYEKI